MPHAFTISSSSLCEFLPRSAAASSSRSDTSQSSSRISELRIFCCGTRSSADVHSSSLSGLRQVRVGFEGRSFPSSSLGTNFVRGASLSFRMAAGMEKLQAEVNNCMPEVWPVNGTSEFGNTVFVLPNGGRKVERTGSASAFFNFNKPTLPSIIAAGDPVLHEPAEEVPVSKLGTPEIEKIINDMVAVMRAAPGVGLAAPQIGVPYKIIVLEDTTEYLGYSDPKEVEAQDRRPFPLLIILNPKLTRVEGPTAVFFEGCLSVEGYRALVERSLKVVVEGIGRDGGPIRVEASGWQARILQHECDHLEGTLYVDRMLPRSFRTQENLRLPLACGCRKPGVYNESAVVTS